MAVQYGSNVKDVPKGGVQYSTGIGLKDGKPAPVVPGGTNSTTVKATPTVPPTTPAPVTPATPQITPPATPSTPTTAAPASPGSYNGVPITPGTDAEVQAQITKIDAGQNAPTVPTPQTPAQQPPPAPPETPQQTAIDQATATEEAVQEQLDQANADFQAKASAVSKTLLDIQNGVIPLNSGEEAQISALQQQYGALIQTQTLTNTSAANGAAVRGYQTGAAEYDPTFTVKTIGAIVTAGSQKIADLNTQMAGAVASLTQSFHTADMAAVKDSFSIYEDAYNKRADTLQKMIDQSTEAIKDAQAQQQKIQDNIDAISEEAAKNGAPPEVLKALNGANSQADAIGIAAQYLTDPTSTAGQYAAYMRDAQSKGLTPMTPADFLSQQKAKDAYNTAYASASASAAVAAANADSPAAQNKLFQQGVSTLKSELSNRSGGLGLQDAKVNQAIHLKALFDQYKETKQVPNVGSAGQGLPGTHEETVYNIPASQYTELAMGLASLISPSNTVAEGTINKITQATARGDINAAITYATGSPQNGSTQEVYQNLKDSIDRQGTVAEQERSTYVNDLLGRLPPGLSQTNYDQLAKSAGLNSYYTPKEQVDQFVQDNPDQADTIAKLYEIPGVTDQDVMDYLNQAQ